MEPEPEPGAGPARPGERSLRPRRQRGIGAVAMHFLSLPPDPPKSARRADETAALHHEKLVSVKVKSAEPEPAEPFHDH